MTKPTDPATLIAEINTAFEAFKQTHTEEIENVKAEDALSKEKLGRIEDSLGRLNAANDQIFERMAATELGSDSVDQVSEAERTYSAQFDTWFRRGVGEEALLAERNNPEIRAAASVGVPEDGGLAAPIEWDRTITDQLVETGQMRSLAASQNVSGQGFKKLYNMHGATSGWVDETEARPETDTPTLKNYEFSFGEIYANPSATQRSLEDPEINIAAWLASEVQTEFGIQEADAFLNGDGVKKPKGILQYDSTTEAALAADKQHPLGPILETKSGVAGGIKPESFIDIIYAQSASRSMGAKFYASRTTHADIRRMKDGQGNFIWQPPFQAGQPSMVLGVGLHTLDGMDDAKTDGNIPVMYGDMKKTYRIFDRVGVSVLRDPYTKKPYVLFYTRKRVGGGLWNPEWMRYMRVGA